MVTACLHLISEGDTGKSQEEKLACCYNSYQVMETGNGLALAYLSQIERYEEQKKQKPAGRYL